MPELYEVGKQIPQLRYLYLSLTARISVVDGIGDDRVTFGDVTLTK